MSGLRWVLLFSLVVGCSSSGQPENEGAPPTLRLADQDDIPTLDPAIGYDTASWQFEEMLFSTLVDYDDVGNLVPELAQTWEVGPDGRTYTFRLRSDVRFSNGRRVVADDVRYGIERVLAPATRSPGAEFFRGIVGAASCTQLPCNVVGIRTLEDDRITFELEQFDPVFLHKLAMPFAAAVPAEDVKRWGEDFARHPLGSGPYVLQEWSPGQRVVATRNPGYFASGVPRLAGVRRAVGVNDQLEWLQYESGQLDVATIPPAEFLTVMREPRYAGLVHHQTTMRTQYLGMDCATPPFADRRVRQAMNYAVNKEKLLRLINNRGVVARGILPPNMPGYNPAVRGYPFDPARARTLLQESGYAAGFTTTLWVRFDDTTLRLAQSIQQDLADVGVHIEIKALAWGPFLDAVRHGDVPLFLLSWEADFPDPSNFLDVLFHSKYIGTNNNTNYRNPEVDALLDQAAHTVDRVKRLELLRQAEEIAIDDAPWVFLYHPVTYRIVHPRVRDFRMHPFRPERFEHVWLDGKE